MHASKSITRATAVFFVLLFGLATGPAIGADKDAVKVAKDQVRRLQEQIRKVEQEKSLALNQKGEVTAKLEIVEADLLRKNGVESRLIESQRRLRAANEEASRLKSELDELKSKLVAAELRSEKADKRIGVMNDAQATLENGLAACTARNEQLYQQGRKLLQAFGNKGQCDVISRHEGIFGFGRVGDENALEAARDSFEELRWEFSKSAHQQVAK